jgi:hypothetical protein
MGLCLRRLSLQYPLSGWQGSTGISGSFQSESVASFDWNRWQVWTGISGNIRPEYARGKYVAAASSHTDRTEGRNA